MNIKTQDKRKFFMQTVYNVASLSKDPRTKIGAVLVKDNDIISVGYNNFPRKIQDLEERYNDREIKHSLVVHAEANAIYNAARKGISTKDSILFTQGVPCSQCTKSVIQAGCSKIVVHKQWPNLVHCEQWVKSIDLSKMLIDEAGITLEWFDHQLYTSGWLDGKYISV